MTETLIDRVRSRLASGAPESTRGLGHLARDEAGVIADSGALLELERSIDAELAGAGPLEPLLAVAGVTDVLVNAPNEVWIDCGSGLERSDVRFDDDAAVRRLAVRLAARCGRRLDDSMPFVDASLPDGTRVHAVLPPLVAHPVISLRVLARRQLSLRDLVQAAAMPPALEELLRRVVGARLTTLISGGTGSGKTTLLSALLGVVPSGERIVTIEDAAELSVDHPHVVGLLTRPANLEQAGRIGLAELVRQSLRMRPDRLVVGEFRGAEVLEILTALNTGHAGGMATIHANSAADVPSRLVALGSLGGVSAEVVLALAASAVDVVVHLVRDRTGVRRVDHVSLWQREGPPTLAWSRSGGECPGASSLARRLDGIDSS
jgi:pilus assembly protein CpaF